MFLDSLFSSGGRACCLHTHTRITDKISHTLLKQSRD